MQRINRATQFAPFDALKGLSSALRLVEFQQEMIEKGEISEEQSDKISRNVINLEKNSIVKLKYYENGHEKIYVGKIKVSVENKVVSLDNKKISLEDVLDLEIEGEGGYDN